MARFKAQFDDLELHCQTIGGSGSKSFQRSEYAGADGAEFDDLGLNGGRFSVTAVFFNANYSDYPVFIEKIKQPDIVHNFVHPVHGLVFGVITSWNERVDSRRSYIEVDFTFEEQEQGDFESRITPLIQPKIENAFTTCQRESIEAFKSRISDALGPGASAVLHRITDGVNSFSTQFIDLGIIVRRFVSDVDVALNVVDSFATQVSQPVDTLISNIDYGTTLPGIFMGSVAAACDRYSALVEVSAAAPYLVMQNFFTGLTALRNAIPGFNGEFDAVRAQVGALLCAKLLAADDALGAEAALIEKTPSWTDDFEYLKKDRTPSVMTANDLERVVSLTRAYLQEAIEQTGEPSLRTMAADLQRHVDSVRLVRERVITIDVATPISLVMLCHKRGLGYAAVDRVLALNPQIKDPTIVSGEVRIYDR